MTRARAVAFVIVMLTAGCASEGSGDGDGPSAAPDAMAGFVDEAEAICAHSTQMIRYVLPPETHEGWRGYGARVASIYGRAVDRLEELDPPEKLAGPYSEWTALLADAGTAFEDLYRTFSRNDPSLPRSKAPIGRAIRASEKIEERADDLVQLEMTDLGACFGVTPWHHARGRVTGACGGFLFCER